MSFSPTFRYVTELRTWEANVRSRGLVTAKNQANSPEENALETFEDMCQNFENLHKIFKMGIYQPLQDFCNDSKSCQVLKNVPKDMERILSQWEVLLSSGVIDEKLFSYASSEGMYPVSIRNRCHDFDPVLRLIPDLTEKAFEVLRLARRWRLIRKTSAAVSREETYVVSKENGRAKRANSKFLRRIKSLESELEQSQAHHRVLQNELNRSNTKCEKIEENLSLHRQKCNQLENELDVVKRRCDVLKEKLEEAHKKGRNNPNELENTQEYCRVLQDELNNARMKYCAQKIKFINTKKRCSQMTSELQNAREQLENLANELGESKKHCQALSVKLDNTKKNIFTQGTMLDVLQNQCFVLKDEVDGAKSKCLQLTCDLDKSRERCESLEKELELVKDTCQDLQAELSRARSKEELLARQNSYLRRLCRGERQTWSYEVQGKTAKTKNIADVSSVSPFSLSRQKNECWRFER